MYCCVLLVSKHISDERVQYFKVRKKKEAEAKAAEESIIFD